MRIIEMIRKRLSTYPLFKTNWFILPLIFIRHPSGKQIQGGIYKLLTLT